MDGAPAYYSVDDPFAGSTGGLRHHHGEPELSRTVRFPRTWRLTYRSHPAVEHVYRGQAAGKPHRPLYGGTAGNVTEIYSPAPQLAAGEEYLLFLNQPSMGGAFHTLGLLLHHWRHPGGLSGEGTAGLYTSQSEILLSPTQLAMTHACHPGGL